MIKLKDILTEEFKPTVVLAKYSGGGNYKPFKQVHFKSKDEANKFIKDMMKKYKLKRQKGFWGNPQTGIELVTNFQETMMINMKDLIKQQGDMIRRETGMNIVEKKEDKGESTWTIVYKGLLAGFKKAKDKRLEVVAKAVGFLIKTEFGVGAKNDFIKAFKKSL